MSGKVGMPVLKLKAGYGHGKHSGSARAVTCEALKERYGSDPDLDRSKTKNNVYMSDGFTSGKALTEYWQKEANAFRTIDKNGKEKKLRSDANIGFANIIKPDKAFMDSLTEEQQIQFLNDCIEITTSEYEKRGMQIDAGVVHTDEQNLHVHLFGHDPEYKLGKKLGLKFFHALNADVPKQLRERGWDIQDCISYDAEATEGMTDEEKAEYKKQKQEEKKSKGHGKSAREYKQDKKQADLDRQEAELIPKIKRNNANRKRIEERQKEQDDREARLKEQEAALAEERERVRLEQEKARKTYSEALQAKEKFEELMQDDGVVSPDKVTAVRVYFDTNGRPFLKKGEDGKPQIQSIGEIMNEQMERRASIRRVAESIHADSLDDDYEKSFG